MLNLSLGGGGPSNFLMRKHERLQSQISEMSHFSEDEDWCNDECMPKHNANGVAGFQAKSNKQISHVSQLTSNTQATDNTAGGRQSSNVHGTKAYNMFGSPIDVTCLSN